MKTITLALATLTLLGTTAQAQTARPTPATSPRPLLLDGMYQSHGVLQRDRPIVVRGHALPGETVSVTLATASARGVADRSGAWRVTLPAMPAGGPYTLTASTPAGARQTLEDMLVGDVWLCSGQSNMELPVQHAMNSWSEVNAAGDDGIRLLKVARDARPTPLAEFANPVSWRAAAPESFRDFSAVCYFMGRELRASEKVPIGLIDSSWGGTAIDAWRSETALAADRSAGDRLAIWRAWRNDPEEGTRRWGVAWGDWWRKASGDAPGTEPWQANAAGGWKPVPAMGTAWESWGDPALANYNGIVWYRTTVTLTAEQARKPATVTLGAVDDDDQSWVNGQSVGGTSGYNIERRYRLAAGTLHAGVNHITVAAIDGYSFGGMTGPAEARAIRFDDGSSVPLDPTWEYRATPGPSQPPHAPWETTSGYAGIYNGMIAPIGDYGLRGVAWYQGEADAGAPDDYADKLMSLMNDWRRQFDHDHLPFVIAELAGWGAYADKPTESGFAQIREEQRLAAAADRDAAVAVTTDLGNARDIHPSDKQEVARRLARAARALTYGAALSPSGPEVGEAQRSGDSVTVTFQGVEGTLVTYSGNQALGFELCGKAVGSCRFVAATVNGNVATLAGPLADATRVRFCWGDTPVCNLYDRSGLPAGPFEIEIR